MSQAGNYIWELQKSIKFTIPYYDVFWDGIAAAVVDILTPTGGDTALIYIRMIILLAPQNMYEILNCTRTANWENKEINDYSGWFVLQKINKIDYIFMWWIVLNEEIFLKFHKTN